MTKNLIAILLAAALSGCIPPQRQMSREQYLQTTQKHYSGVDAEKVLQLAEQMFTLSDGNDYSFSYTDSGLRASRFYNVYLVFGISQGNFVWDVDTVRENGGVLVKIQVEDRSGGLGNPTMSRFYNTPATYDLFWRRLDYLLGKSDHWPTCSEASALYQNNETLWGDISPWCYVTADKRPD